MDVLKLISFLFSLNNLCTANYYRAPSHVEGNWESYVIEDKEYVVQSTLVNWQNAMILCRGYHNGTLAIIDTRDKAEFLAEALAESRFGLSTAWVGARRDSANDPAGYRWGPGMELRRTANDVLSSEKEDNITKHFPIWLNRTHVPVPDGGADCVALERVNHDYPVFLDLPCLLERPFVCERDARVQNKVTIVNNVKCKEGMYHVYSGQMTWDQAAAYCVIRDMTLANIGTMKCLKKLGMIMLKNRPSIENAWIGAKGYLGKWAWIDSGVNVFHPPTNTDIAPDSWPPMRDRSIVKPTGCLQVDRHATHDPVFLEARCDRKMDFICYEGDASHKPSTAPPSDDFYNYLLIMQKHVWQRAYENCQRLNGSLAHLDDNDILIQLLLLMGENINEPIHHVWLSGRLNMTKDINTNAVNYAWYNPSNYKRIPDPKAFGDSTIGLYMPPWLDEDFSMDASCMNLDRQDHLVGLVYGLPCDTPQYSICMIEKNKQVITLPQSTQPPAPPIDPGYESS